jgi:uncharacterized membrane protein YecN with MAPEG domain
MDGEKKWWQNVILVTLVFVCGLNLTIARSVYRYGVFLSIRKLPVEGIRATEFGADLPVSLKARQL